MVTTLLPSHKTAIQKALDALSGERFEGLDISVISVLPLTCPAEILPHLAQSFDVDINGLNERQTRELLQEAFQIHYYAGTLYSIRKALNVIFKNTQIEEWFEYEGNPYYFRVVVNSDQYMEGIDEGLIEQLIKTANRYKNARSLIDSLRLKAKSEGKINIGAILDSSIGTTIYPGEGADIANDGIFYVGGSVFNAINITIEADNE